MLLRLIIGFAFLLPIISLAQDDDDLDLILEREQKSNVEVADEKVENLDIKSVSGLEKLVPFSDIAVIQRRFLPRTGRFEVFPNVGLVLNDAFFSSMLYGARFSYHLSEKWGLEFSYLGASSSEKTVTEDIRSELNTSTATLVEAKSYYGIDLKWVPIYGKMALANRSIVPYDTYFSLGTGILNTNQSDSSIPLHLGVGQSFAISKMLALRWDASFYWYTADVKLKNGTESGSFMNLHLTIGASFFFPEAKYR